MKEKEKRKGKLLKEYLAKMIKKERRGGQRTRVNDRCIGLETARERTEIKSKIIRHEQPVLKNNIVLDLIPVLRDQNNCIHSLPCQLDTPPFAHSINSDVTSLSMLISPPQGRHVNHGADALSFSHLQSFF